MCETYNLVKLHDYPQMIGDCVLLLNSEWPRNETSRLRSLQQSRDSLPMSLILINGNHQLIGHVKLKSEQSKSKTVFIECLIVNKCERGKGFGKLIMNEVENYCRPLGIEKLLLTTTDKIGFYESLGYQTMPCFCNNNIFKTESNKSKHEKVLSLPALSALSVLPPPPPPMPINNTLSVNNLSETKVFMQKFI